MEKIETGEIEIVEKETYPPKDYRERTIQRGIWKAQKKSVDRVEKKYGIKTVAVG